MIRRIAAFFLMAVVSFGEIHIEPAVRTVPVFEFNLVYFDPAVTGLVLGTEIELKASTNNFSVSTNFAYWGDTLHTNLPGYASFGQSDAAMSVYYADYSDTDADGNTRDLTEFVTDGSGGMLTDAIGAEGYVSRILVCPSSSDRFGRSYNWMTESNTNVVWVWRPRGVISEGPKNADGDPLWFSCRPVEWRNQKLKAD